MKKLRLATLVLSAIVSFSLTACQQPEPVKDNVCSTTGNSSLPGMIDPDCPAPKPAK